MKNLLYIILALSLVANIYFVYECCFDKECCSKDEKCENGEADSLKSNCNPWTDITEEDLTAQWNYFNEKLGYKIGESYTILCQAQIDELFSSNKSCNAIIVYPCLKKSEPPALDKMDMAIRLGTYNGSTFTISPETKNKLVGWCPDMCPSITR